MFVKICGTTTVEDAQHAVAAGADALGFIFAPSKRRVSVAQVAAITRSVPDTCLRAGVFTHPRLAEIIQTVHDAGLSAVQMHFSYDSEAIAALFNTFGADVELWQVIPVPVDPPDQQAADRELEMQLRQVLADTRLGAVLLDSAKGGASGGLGTAFPWARVRSLLDRIPEGPRAAGADTRPKIMLAGGLNPENVSEAISILRPAGVDVVSGVESSPGRKDPGKVAAFLCAARDGAATSRFR